MLDRNRVFARFSVLCFGLFALLAIVIMLGLNRSFDPFGLAIVQQIDSPVVLLAANILSILGSFEVTGLVALILSAWLYTHGHGLAALAPLLFAATMPIELVAKLVVPQQPLLPDVFSLPFDHPVLDFIAPYPFPSGHAARVAFWLAFGIPILYMDRRWSMVIELSIYGAFGLLGRLVLREHWPTDVIGGVLLGSGFGFLACNAVTASMRSIRPLGLKPLLLALFGLSTKS